MADTKQDIWARTRLQHVSLDIVLTKPGHALLEMNGGKQVACKEHTDDLAAVWHLIFSLMALGYGFEYYFHLSMFRLFRPWGGHR